MLLGHCYVFVVGVVELQSRFYFDSEDEFQIRLKVSIGNFHFDFNSYRKCWSNRWFSSLAEESWQKKWSSNVRKNWLMWDWIFGMTVHMHTMNTQWQTFMTLSLNRYLHWISGSLWFIVVPIFCFCYRSQCSPLQLQCGCHLLGDDQHKIVITQFTQITIKDHLDNWILVDSFSRKMVKLLFVSSVCDDHPNV